ncbi:MAG TPA: ABC transporter permease [Caulobacteraceae bacterium]|jgi:capsular polysaccharide transport system permease protein|nr:ABC transporter permease [Caulobacteraceae bacterium]
MTEISATPPADERPAGPIPRVQNAGFVTATPLVFQYRVLKALVLREIATRGGEHRIGYLLSIITPIVTLSAMVMMFGLRGKVIPSGFPLGVFVVTGYPLWQNFQGLYTIVMNQASRGDPLLMFPQITQLDLIFSTIVLEFATKTVVFVVLCVGVCFVFHDSGPADPLGVIFCFWGCMWIGAAVGMILCALNRALPLLVQFLNTFMRFGMWVSGVLYSVNRLPSFLWPYLQWNPILHLIEGCRTLWNPAFVAPIFDPTYVIVIGFVLTTAGFVLERLTRRLVG